MSIWLMDWPHLAVQLDKAKTFVDCLQVVNKKFLVHCSVWSKFRRRHSNELQILERRLVLVLVSVDIRTSVDKKFKDLDWIILTYRWEHHLFIQASKCLKGIAPTYNFTFTHSVHSKCIRIKSHNLVIQKWKTNFGKKTFHCRAAYYGTSFLLMECSEILWWEGWAKLRGGQKSFESPEGGTKKFSVLKGSQKCLPNW